MTEGDLAAFRQDLHAHPEIGFAVERTADRIAAVLERAGLAVAHGIGQTGVVASLIRGQEAIGFRADMDALPIQEAGDVSYRSTNPGAFHGCGHDGHAAMLVGAALRLANDRELTRSVHFVFQPDEECGQGARAMIEDGLFERFPMEAIYGLHNLPGLELGAFATRDGAFCAFEDNFEIHITGRGGHASMPEHAIDPIVVGSDIVLQLQSIVARSVPAAEQAVVSVTEFETDGARNILASTVTLRGDCRGFRADVSKLIERRMREIVEGICKAHGASGHVAYDTSFVPLINDTQATGRAVAAARAVGPVDATAARMSFSEDFAAFLEHCPGAFVLIGNGVSGAHAQPLHNPSYDFNDAAIPYGVAFWEQLAKQ